MDICPNCPTPIAPTKIAAQAIGGVNTPIRTRTRKGSRLLPAVRDAIGADIGRGKLSFTAIAKIHNTTRATVHAIARGRGMVSPYSPRLTRTEAAKRAEKRESKAHGALTHKERSFKDLDSDTLSKIAERASGSLDKHIAALERANIPPAQIVISPDIRILANIFAITPQAPRKALSALEGDDLGAGVSEGETVESER